MNLMFDGMKKKLESYETYPSDHFREKINEIFSEFYNDTIRIFVNANAIVFTSIRNSIEHANIRIEDGIISLNDQNNQNDDTNTNFNCSCKKEELFEIIESLDLETTQKAFSLTDFMEELKAIISSDLYDALVFLIT